ncbi:MAG TPA: IS630 family transposase [Allocoleopsis sp.]
MRFIRGLSAETQKMLKRIQKSSKSAQVRQRASCILLSHQGFKIEELILICKVTRKTVSSWLTAWDNQQLVGLYNQKGRGRKPKLTEAQEREVKAWVKEEPKQLHKVQEKIEKEWGVKISKDTIKRTVKKNGMRWKRVRRTVRGKAQDWELEVKIPKLKELIELDKEGKIDLRYLDESGLCLIPNVPYAWQEKEAEKLLLSSQSKRKNILGIMNKRNEIYYEIHQGTINSEMVIKSLDKFSENLSKTTVIIMDQASIHTSEKILEKLEEWKKKNLEIFWLPPYSPHLNLIEILWRFIKYEWIELSAYDSWENLNNYLKKVLDLLGTEYVINFA